MFNFDAGLTAIRANQIALQTSANNIANAGTEDYHRQVAHFTDRAPSFTSGLAIGQGVELSYIQQVRNSILENSLTNNISLSASAASTTEIAARIESLFIPQTGSLADRLQNFFNDVEQLTPDSSDPARRDVVLGSANSLTAEFNALVDHLDSLETELTREIASVVDEINRLSVPLAEIQNRIDRAEGAGENPNDLRDERDRQINNLAELTNIQRESQGTGQTGVALAKGAAIVIHRPVNLELRTNSDRSVYVTRAGEQRPLEFGGRLGALIESRNGLISDVRDKVNEFAQTLIQAVDSIHSTGVGLDGGFEILHGHRAVSDPAALLVDAETSFEITSGELLISVTNEATGDRVRDRIAIDPASQSLQDVAAAISSVDNVQAVVNIQTNTLSIFAAPGFTFDFSAQLESDFNTAAITGTANPGLHGRYTGSANDTYTFQATGSGEIGVTDGLQVEVQNGSGSVIAVLDVGLGYEADSLLYVAEGVQISLGPGTLNAGDNFATDVIAETDSAGVLTALGLNTFFQGNSAADVAISDEILRNPDRFASSFTGPPSDSENANRLTALRDVEFELLGGQTFERTLASTTAEIGQITRDSRQFEVNLGFLNDQLVNERESISGVDPNEELVRMIQYQRSFQAAARYIAAIDETLVDLMNILR